MGCMAGPRGVPIPRRSVAQLGEVIGADRLQRLTEVAGRFRARLGGRTIWNVNSTATGGGVAEMLNALLGYVLDLDLDVRWLVIGGDPDFFALTKGLHNRIHGAAAGGALTRAAADHYEQVLAANAEELTALVRPDDIVVLHDPQTAGLAGHLARHGARVVWRCHIGADRQNEVTRPAWEFLRPYVLAADAYVFSRSQYRPAWVPAERTWAVPPSIDPFAPKNQDLDPDAVAGILRTIGVLDGGAGGLDGGAGGGANGPHPGSFVRLDGSAGEVTRAASVVAEARPGPDDPVVLQVSRWDRLKDMGGVMKAFADHVAPAGLGYLVLAGPQVSEVSDDPEGAAVHAECLAAWRALPTAVRRRILLVTLPMDDVDENAAMVNALQRHAAVIAQKSLAEGFGLTVAEAMWKRRPVVGAAVGGIQDQVVDGTGVLVDPYDLGAFGSTLRRLLDEPGHAMAMGEAAHAHVQREYVGDLHLLRYAQLFETLLPDR